MKRLYYFFTILLFISGFVFLGCASSSTNLGEPDYEANNVLLPNGKTIETMYFFKTLKSANRWIVKSVRTLAVEAGTPSYYRKHSVLTNEEKIAMKKGETIETDDWFYATYTYDEIGSLGQMMKELEYEAGTMLFKQDDVIIIVAIVAEKKFTKFVYEEYICVDEATYETLGQKTFAQKLIGGLKKATDGATDITEGLVGGAFESLTAENSNSQDWHWYGGNIGYRAGGRYGTQESEEGFWYRVVYNDGVYCYCIRRDTRTWYLRDSVGNLTPIATSNVPAKVRALVE